MTIANSSCAAENQSDVPSARNVSMTYWRFFATTTFSYGADLRGDLEDVRERVALDVIVDDLDVALDVAVERAESRRELAYSASLKSHCSRRLC